MPQKKAIIIGAGPAGLTTAYELLHYTDIKPVIFEASSMVGGISRTINYKGNRVDIGGHRFFSKSQRVLQWWLNIFPLQGAPARDDIECERNLAYSDKSGAPDPEKEDQVMLKRRRVSRIFYNRKFLDYPLRINANLFSNLGLKKISKIAFDYTKVRVTPFKKENSLEDFFINRFGKELYNTFFKDYTEKVWGVPPAQIDPQWGIQRIKGVSIGKVISHAVKRFVAKDDSVSQKNTENSLIEQFLYPKYGPGQIWEAVARIIATKGGFIHANSKVVGIRSKNNKVIEVDVQDFSSTNISSIKGDYFFSTMPVKNLIESWQGYLPKGVKEVADGLAYRDFLTVGLLVKKLKVKNQTNIKTVGGIIPDNWIYVQEKDVKLGRIQIFNNWSPYMVRNRDTIWLGLEYFCNEGDDLWSNPDQENINFAVEELAKIGFVDKNSICDGVVIRSPKTYPAYWGGYRNFYQIREFTDSFSNLFLIGRNGMHRYNNTDHSMLTAMTAVDNLIQGNKDKNNIWSVNTEDEYCEVKNIRR